MNTWPNLTGSSCIPCAPGSFPWEQSFTPPAEVHADKGKRHTWITNSRTAHCVYSLVEGANKALRISKDNPPLYLHGLAADYDCPLTEEAAQDWFSRYPGAVPKPNWVEATLSGNRRLVWLFEQPVPVPTTKIFQEFIQILAKEWRLDSLLPGLDRGALIDPARRFTAGTWQEGVSDRVPSELLFGWIVEAAKPKLTKDLGPTIPLDKIVPELAKRYPAFSTWPGEFVVGAQGPSFWVEGSTSPKSAVVHDTGVFSFAAHAEHPFASWETLLGHAWVSQYQTEQLSHLVDGFYYDGKDYFYRDVQGVFQSNNEATTTSKLRHHIGLDKDRLQNALLYIKEINRVKYAAPFAFKPSGRMEHNNKPVLNTWHGAALSPAPSAERTQWPFIDNYLTHLFGDYLPYVFSWVKHVYTGCVNLELQPGPALVIAGGVGVGKTFFSTVFLAKLLGGFSDVTQYAVGDDRFGSEIWEYALLAVDDMRSNADPTTRKKFSETVKRLVANRHHSFHEKFRVPGMIEWCGRFVLTTNRDENSILALPDMSLSNQDKVTLLPAADEVNQTFDQDPQKAARVLQELPFFGRWLLSSWEIPVEFQSSRFGVKAIQDPELLTIANHSSASAMFKEQLHAFCQSFFGADKNAKEWRGTATLLVNEMVARGVLQPGTRPHYVGPSLAALKSKGEDIGVEEGNVRTWIIRRPKNL